MNINLFKKIKIKKVNQNKIKIGKKLKICLVVAEWGRPKVVAMEADRVRRVIYGN